MKIRNIFITALSIFVVLSAASGVYAQRPHGQFGRGPIGAPFLSQLTESQKTELKALMQDLRNQSADREAVRDAIQMKLNEWGIEMPEPPKGIGPFGDKLTDDQKNELQTLIADLKTKDAKPEDIRKAVQDKLKEWGFALPERHGGFGRGPRGFLGQLTDEQKDSIQALIKDMKANGATREEIREAVNNQLDAWGVERPQPPGGRRNPPVQKQDTQSGRKTNAWNHPNPFNPETTINYQIDNPADVTVSIYNTQGQCVRTLNSGYEAAGQHNIRWDGKSDSGATVPTGMYIYKIQAGETTLSSGRMMMIK